MEDETGPRHPAEQQILAMALALGATLHALRHAGALSRGQVEDAAGRALAKLPANCEPYGTDIIGRVFNLAMLD